MIFRKKKYAQEELIAGCLKNNRQAQEALYKRYFPVMMSMCLKHTKDKDRSLEILNDGFFKVFSKIQHYQNKGSFEGWIRRIVYHSIVDYYRANKKHQQLVSPDDLLFEVVSEKATDRLAVDDLFSLVNTLPKTTKDVFMLFAVEGYKHIEIAQILGISTGTSKWHLSKARTTMKGLLLQRDNIENYLTK